MSNIVWFPVPVATLFRRLVNVISTASIAHHYFLPSRSSPAFDDSPEHQHDLDPRSACRLLRENGSQSTGAVHASLRKTGEDALDGFLKGMCATITLCHQPQRHNSIGQTLASLAYKPLSLPPRVQIRAATRRTFQNGRRRRTQSGSHAQSKSLSTRAREREPRWCDPPLDAEPRTI